MTFTNHSLTPFHLLSCNLSFFAFLSFFLRFSYVIWKISVTKTVCAQNLQLYTSPNFSFLFSSLDVRFLMFFHFLCLILKRYFTKDSSVKLPFSVCLAEPGGKFLDKLINILKINLQAIKGKIYQLIGRRQ